MCITSSRKQLLAPRTKAPSLQQTPWLRNTTGFGNFSEHRQYVDGVLKEELGPCM